MQYPHAHVGAITRKINDIKALMQAESAISQEELKNHYLELINRQSRLSDAYHELYANSSDDERKNLDEWYNAKMADISPFIQSVSSQLHGTPVTLLADSQIITHGSNSILSQVSTSSATRVRLAEQRAKAVADERYRLEIRKKQYELEDIQSKRSFTEMQLLENELDKIDNRCMQASANMVDLLLPERDPVPTQPESHIRSLWTTPNSANGLGNSELDPLVIVNKVVTTQVCNRGKDEKGEYDLVYKNYFDRLASQPTGELGRPILQNRAPISNVVPTKPLDTLQNLGAIASLPLTFEPKVPVTDIPQNPVPVPDAHVPDIQPHCMGGAPPTGAPLTASDFVRAVREVTGASWPGIKLPKKRLRIFDGSDPTEYMPFMLEFQRTIVPGCKTDLDRYQYLEQQTADLPQQLVRSCNQVDPSRALTQARELLNNKYGDEYLISSAYIKKLHNWPIIRPNDKKGLEELSMYLIKCSNVSANMTDLNQLNNPAEILKIVQKLPYEYNKKFQEYCFDVRKRNGLFKFVDLVGFVERESDIANQPMFAPSKLSNPQDLPRPKPQPRGRVFATQVEKDYSRESLPSNGCLLCRRVNHELDRCYMFKTWSYNDKRKFLKDKNICYGCLNSTQHNYVQCKRRLKCQICKRTHASSMHYDGGTTSHETASYSRLPNRNYVNDDRMRVFPQEQPVLDMNKYKVPPPAVKIMHSIIRTKDTKRRKIMHAVVPVKVHCRDGRYIRVYAVLDGCSSDNWMSEGLLQKLGIHSQTQTVAVTTMERKNSPVTTRVVNNLTVTDLSGEKVALIPVLYTRREWPFDASDVPCEADIESYEHLKDIPFEFIDSRVELLIGMSQPDLIKYHTIIESPIADGPYATRHYFGWSINGPVESEVHKRASCYRIKINNFHELENRIESLFSQDYNDLYEAVDSESLSIEDKKWYQEVESSIKLLDTGHYQIELPFRNSTEGAAIVNKGMKHCPYQPSMPCNIVQAQTRFRSAQRRFIRDPQHFHEYKAFMDDMLTKGYAERVPPNELTCESSSRWYLVHHPVYHRVKKKLRVVFDCSLKYNGVSLNDLLLSGPDLTNNLLGVLLRFRHDHIAVTADIEKMFFQTRVPIEHADYMRFLWFPGSDPTQEPVECRILVHVFGAKSSPSVANFALRQTVKDFPEFSPSVKNSILDSFYVDDFLHTFKTPAAAFQHSGQVMALLAKGGFKLTSFISNSSELMECFRQSQPDMIAKRFNQLNLFEEDMPYDRALGVIWNVESDSLGIKLNLETKPKTRRGLLSTSFSLYDPMGLVSPACLLPKKLFQETCKLKLDWDDPLPPHVQEQWDEWLLAAPLLCQYQMPRCCTPTEEIKTHELHLFSDGSEVAYGVIAFGRFTTVSGSIHCSPLLSKSRLNPLSDSLHPSIPRIELQAARLAVETSSLLQRELQFNFTKVIYWTDSTTVLQYLNNKTKRFQRYVANRVAFIRRFSIPSQWKYVPGRLNPSDIASRGMSPSKLLTCSLWKNGPDFLYLPESEWPIFPNLPPIDCSDKEIKTEKIPKIKVLLTRSTPLEFYNLMDRLFMSSSSWYKLQRRVAWLLRVKSCLRTGRWIKTDLTLPEINAASQEIYRVVQGEYYASVLYDICTGSLSRNHPLQKLHPFLHTDGILRVGGRIRNAMHVPFTAKHPVILPADSYISELLIRNIHHMHGHMGKEHLRNSIRENYWIVKECSLIKRVLKNCITCRKQHARLNTQVMADLPTDRVQSDLPPFSSCGIDFYGPFTVVNGRRTEKRYGIVFSCMASRAIHLEVSHSLSTDSFINALRRFLARRGEVQSIRSDNGTNLVGAEKELKASIKEWNEQHISREMQKRNIEWNFNPPFGSHFGGAWEREIRTIRQILYAMLNEQPMKLTDESLYTLFCEVESILNNRPLTPVSSDPNDIEALTPNHLILGRSGVSLPPGIFDRGDIYAKRKWRQVQYLANLYWTRFRKSYLNLLQSRQKWTVPRPSVTLNDLVLLAEPVLPRNQWSLGRIVEVYPGEDGHIREVDVRVHHRGNPSVKDSTTILRRPIVKIAVLMSS